MRIGLSIAVTRSGGVSAWQLSTESGLLLWLRADMGVTGTTNVTTWADQSGNSNDYTAVTGPSTGGILAGQDALSFDATNAELMTGPTYSASACEVFCVMRNNADPPPSPGSGLWDFSGDLTQNVHVPLFDGNVYEGFGSTLRKSAGNPTQTFAADVAYNVRSEAGLWSCHINAEQIFSTVTNTVGFRPTNTVIGWDGAGTFYHDGLIADIFMFDHVLGASARTDAEAYIFNRYGITI